MGHKPGVSEGMAPLRHPGLAWSRRLQGNRAKGWFSSAQRMGKNGPTHFRLSTIPVASLSASSPLTSSEMLPLTPAVPLGSDNQAVPLPCHTAACHWQDVAADLVGGAWSHADPRGALPGLARLTGVETCFHRTVSRGQRQTQGMLGVKIFGLIPNYNSL